jgi:hypothetical protein
MILADLKIYLQERGQATLSDLVTHFDASPVALRPMLDLWMRKGKVECLHVSPDCGGNCNRCAPEVTEIYRWSGEGPGDRVS